jgi:hypothetical protein
LKCEGPLPGACSATEGVQGGVATMAIVWVCPLPVEEYLAAGRDVAVPRPDCVGCQTAMMFWSGYERSLRVDGRCHRLWVRRARCRDCRVTASLIPDFCLVGRLDVVDTVGETVRAVVVSSRPVGSVADEIDVPYTTARDWLRRFRRRAALLAAGFASLVVEIGGMAPRLADEAARAAVGAVDWAWTAARLRSPCVARSCWMLASLVTGGRLLAANSDPPWTVLGNRRWIPPVP